MIELRRPDQGDILSMARLTNNRKVWENLRDHFPFPYLESDAREFIDQCRSEVPPVTFAITYQGEFCGVAGFNLADMSKEAELGYWLGEPYWNKGIATEAVRKMVRYGFEKLLLNKITAAVFEFNTYSERVLQGAGFSVTEDDKNHFSTKNGHKVREIHYLLRNN